MEHQISAKLTWGSDTENHIQSASLNSRTVLTYEHISWVLSKIELLQNSSRCAENTQTAASFNLQPAKLLNELLQAYHQIEKSICSPGHEIKSEEARRKELDLCTYLTSSDHLVRWKTGFSLLGQRYLQGFIAPEAFESMLAKILVGVERLEEAKSKLEEDFERELQKCGISVVVPDSFWESIEAGCSTLETAFTELEKRLDDKAGEFI